jgi:hypothetical protein
VSRKINMIELIPLRLLNPNVHYRFVLTNCGDRKEPIDLQQLNAPNTHGRWWSEQVECPEHPWQVVE